MSQLALKITGTKGILFEQKVHQVDCPTQAGRIGILANHTPLVAILEPGELTIYASEKSNRTVKIKGGYLRVDESGCSIMVEDGADDLKEQLVA